MKRATGTVAGDAHASGLSWFNPAHIVLAFVLLVMPALTSDFVLFSIFAWALCLGMVALSLMFLAGYGGMVSLAQLTVAGVAGYMVAILGTNGMNLGLEWPWWAYIPVAILIAVVFATITGALAVRTAGIYTIMITLAIAAAFFYFTRQNYDIFNGWNGFNLVLPPKLLGVDWRAARAILLSGAGVRRAQLCGRALRVALALRPRIAGHPRQPAAHGSHRLRCFRAPDRRLQLSPG